MCFGYVPIFIGGGGGLRVEQRGPVRGANNPSLKDYLRSQKKWKIALRKNPKLIKGYMYVCVCMYVMCVCV